MNTFGKKKDMLKNEPSKWEICGRRVEEEKMGHHIYQV